VVQVRGSNHHQKELKLTDEFSFCFDATTRDTKAGVAAPYALYRKVMMLRP
jgi:hypothetical protein